MKLKYFVRIEDTAGNFIHRVGGEFKDSARPQRIADDLNMFFAGMQLFFCAKIGEEEVIE